MPVDLSVFGRQKTILDMQQLQAEFEQKKALQQAQIAKAGAFDLDKAYDQVLYKKATGADLTPQEQAIGLAGDAKKQSTQFNPVTGQPYINKDAFAGLGGVSPQQSFVPGAGSSLPPNVTPQQKSDASIPDPFKEQYDAQMRAAGNNAKLKQELTATYMKSKLSFNEGQAKDATYADRIANALPSIDDKQAENNTLTNHMLAGVPLVGNYLVPDGYQDFNRAQTDFATGVLRQESGASINPSEFTSNRTTYLPAPGDGPEVLAAKAKARALALQGMQRGAGPAYVPPQQKQQIKDSLTGKKTIHWDDLK